MPHHRLLARCMAALILCAPARQALAQPDPPVDDLASRAGQYVVDYGQQISLVIGIDGYAQWMQNADQIRPLVRNTVSEFAPVRVGDRQDRLQQLFLDSPATAVQSTRPIADASAHCNHGPLQRNVNVPTTALFVLHPANRARFGFEIEGAETQDGVRVLKVRYGEEKKPTIIRTSAGKDMPVKGQFWIEPADSRVFKTAMERESDARLTGGNSRMADNRFEEPFQGSIRPEFSDRRARSTVSITVTHKRDARLDPLLPGEMVEICESPFRSQFNGTESVSTVNGRATDADFTRFETSGRVIIR